MKILIIALLGLTVLAGCENTWHGAGRDVENMGKNMQKQF